MAAESASGKTIQSAQPRYTDTRSSGTNPVCHSRPVTPKARAVSLSRSLGRPTTMSHRSGSCCIATITSSRSLCPHPMNPAMRRSRGMPSSLRAVASGTGRIRSVGAPVGRYSVRSGAQPRAMARSRNTVLIVNTPSAQRLDRSSHHTSKRPIAGSRRFATSLIPPGPPHQSTQSETRRAPRRRPGNPANDAFGLWSNMWTMS